MTRIPARPRPPWWAVALLTAGILALAGLAAIGAADTPGTGTSRQIAADIGWDPRQVLTWFVLGVLGLVVYTVLASPRGRLERQGGGRRRATPTTVFLALAIVAAFFLLAGPGDEGPGGDEAPALPGGGSPAEALPAQQSGSITGLVALLVVMAGAATVVLFLASRDGTAIEEAIDLDPLIDSVDGALRQLELGGDPRMNVIAAYTGMEVALAGAGVPRRRHEAPHEYVARSLQRLEVDPHALREMTRLFEEARFSTHPVSSAMAEEAIAALQRVRATLEPV